MSIPLIAADELMAARYQMALSLGFHIILSSFGVALPAMIWLFVLVNQDDWQRDRH